jgi:hypothetical protein
MKPHRRHTAKIGALIVLAAVLAIGVGAVGLLNASRRDRTATGVGHKREPASGRHELAPPGARTLAPAGNRRGTLRFELVALQRTAIRAASLRNGDERRELSPGRVRVGAGRGVLYVRVPPAWRATWRRTRLMLGYSSPPNVSDVSCGFAGFRAGAWPGGCWRPYGSASPFNQLLPSTPRLAHDSARIVARLLSFGRLANLLAGQADRPDDYGHPTYYPHPTDPVFRLHCYQTSWGRCAIEGDRIHVPGAARPAAGGDAHITVVDQASGWEYDLDKVRSKPAGGGTLSFRWGGRTRIDGDGLGSDATAARFGNLAGIIRASELAAGHIDHALFMVARCDAGRYVYPAKKSGLPCRAIGLPTRDAPPMGTRLQLAMTAEQIAALRVPAWKKTILRAMARYGLILGDTGGGSWGIQAESGSTYTSFGVSDPLVTFARANGWTPYEGRYVANLESGVDWARYLRVVDPCISKRTC